MSRRVDTAALLWGLVLIAVGVLFLLDRFGVADVDHLVHRYWPMILVVIGLAKLLRRKVWPAFWLIATGLWLQIVQLRLFGLTLESSWPLLLIAFGAAIIGRALLETVNRHETP